MKQRNKIQKVLMGIAVISYVAAIACAMIAAYLSDGTCLLYTSDAADDDTIV